MSQEVDATRIPELQAVVGSALARARELGASAADADASVQKGLTATVRMGEVDTIEYRRDRGMAVTVYFGHRKGSASTADLRPEAVELTVAKACAIARHTASDECAGLADAQAMAREFPDLDLDHPWNLEPEQAIEIARACEAAGLAVDPRLANSEGASLSTQRGVHVYGNTHGFLAGYPSTSHALSCTLLAQSGSDMQRDHWYSVARAATELQPGAQIGRRAGERAIARLGARRLGTCRVPVIYSPEMARGLYAHFLGAIRGTSQYRRASFLLDAAGQQVFPSFLQMQERPRLPRALASASFDAEGVATRDRELVRDGVLDGYVLGSYSARKLGLATTGNAGGVHNLLVGGAPAGQRRLRRPAGAHAPRPVRDRAARPGRQRRHRRLFARRQRLLGRGRGHRLSGQRDHHRREPARHVPRHRRGRHRCRRARRDSLRIRAAGRADGRRRVGGSP